MYYSYYVMNNVMSHAINYLIDYNLHSVIAEVVSLSQEAPGWSSFGKLSKYF